MSSTSLERYTDTDESEHEIAKRRIATTLTNEARGRYTYDENGERHDNTISSVDLAERTPVSASTVRDLVPVVRREYGLPIGSASGYFLIETHEEFVRQVERQRRQARTSEQTAREIARAWNQRRHDNGS